MLAGSSDSNSNWDKKLGDKLSGPDVPRESWNTPPSDLWDKIEAGLPEKKRRFGLIWWSGGLALILLVGFLSFHFLRDPISGSVKNVNKGDIEIKINENRQTETIPKEDLSNNNKHDIAEKANSEVTGKTDPEEGNSSSDAGLPSNKQVQKIKVPPTEKSSIQNESEFYLTENKLETNKIDSVKFSKIEVLRSIDPRLQREEVSKDIFSEVGAINGKPIGMLDNEKFNIDEIPIKRESIKNSRGSFIVGINVGLFADFANLNNEYSSLVEPFNFRNGSMPGVEAGISLGYRINSNWSLISGVQYHLIRATSGHNAQLIYDPSTEIYEGGNYYHTYDMTYATSYGTLPAQMTIARATDAVQEETQVGVEIDMVQNISMINIPLMVRRKLVQNKNGKWSLHLAAGPSLSVPFNNTTRIEENYSDHSDLYIHRSEIKGDLDKINPVLWNGEFELINTFSFGRAGDLSIVPFYRYGFTPLFEDDNLSSRSNEVGVRLYYLFD
jgi:hypothetical protein